MPRGDGEPGSITPIQEERMAEMMEALMIWQEERFQDIMEARMTIAGTQEEG